MQKYRLYQQLIIKGVERTPDFIVVCIDSNCTSHAATKNAILQATYTSLRNHVIAACPNPHVECWYMADPVAFQPVVGCRPALRNRKCASDYCKRVLADAIRRAGHLAALSGIEFASDIVKAMDAYKAGRRDPSLKAFMDDFRAMIRRIRRPRLSRRFRVYRGCEAAICGTKPIGPTLLLAKWIATVLKNRFSLKRMRFVNACVWN